MSAFCRRTECGTLLDALKLPLSTVITGLVFVGLVVYFYALQTANEAKTRATAQAD